MSKTPKVRVFSTQTCPWCEKTKEFLKKNNIPFEAIDVTHDEKAKEEMIGLSKQMGVPVIDIDGKIIVGFDQPELKRLLHIK